MIRCKIGDKTYECVINGDSETVETELADLLLAYFFATPDCKLNSGMKFDLTKEEDVDRACRLIHEDLTNVALKMVGFLGDDEYMEEKRKSITFTTPFDLTALVKDAKKEGKSEE